MEFPTLLVHISAGILAILTGTGAIFVAKGALRHRQSGLVFVYAMIVLGVTACMIAIMRDLKGLLVGGPLAVYLVVTAVTTVRPIGLRLDRTMIAMAMATSVASLWFVVNSYVNGNGIVDGVPAPMLIIFGTVAFFSALADIRVMRAGGLQGPRRIARHLWRMCFAFWIATGSFFLGQMDKFPVWLQNGLLMSIPAFFPIAAMVYWLWRVRLRRRMSGMTLRPAVAR